MIESRLKKLAKKIKKDLAKEVASFKKNISGDGTPRFNLQYGTTIFRPYFDPKSEQLVRNLYLHWVGVKGKIRPIKCIGEDCPMCEVAHQAKDEVGKSAWRLGFDAQITRMMLGQIFRTSYESEYLRKDEPIAITMRRTVSEAILRFLDDLPTIAMAKLLDPERKVNPLQLRWEKGKGNKAGAINVSIDQVKSKSMDPLPDDFPSLDEIWIPEDEKPSDEDVYSAVKEMKNILKNKSEITEPDEDEGETGIDEDEEDENFSGRKKNNDNDDDDDEDDTEEEEENKSFTPKFMRRKPRFASGR